jgi:hypothetical protein
VLFPPPDPARSAQTQEINRGRNERRQLRLQDTTPEQVCFVAASQIGELKSSTLHKNGETTGKTWPVITSADPKDWKPAALLKCRRKYWGIEAGHQRLDITLDEDRSRVRTPRAMTVLGMFRRLTVSLACAWLDNPHRRKLKMSTSDFQEHLRVQGARRGFSLVTSLLPKAWRGG